MRTHTTYAAQTPSPVSAMPMYMMTSIMLIFRPPKNGITALGNTKRPSAGYLAHMAHAWRSVTTRAA